MLPPKIMGLTQDVTQDECEERLSIGSIRGGGRMLGFLRKSDVFLEEGR